jgi:protein-disulfide isomerase
MAHNPTVQSPKRRDKGSVPTSATSASWLTSRRLIAIVAVGVVVLAGILIGVSVAGSGNGEQSSGKVAGGAATQTLLQGIPQRALALGNPKAPVTLVEYGDLQCPICREYAVATLPTIVRDYVRAGKVRLEFRGLAFIGADSETALKAAIAAGAQNRGWNMIDLLYRNQGQENSGWVTESTLKAAAAAIPGLYVGQWLDDRGSAATQTRLVTMRAQARRLMGSQIRTPTFEVGRTGQQLRYLPITSLDASAFTPALDQRLSG